MCHILALEQQNGFKSGLQKFRKKSAKILKSRVAPIFVDPEMLIISFDEIIHENIQNDRHFGAYRSYTRSMLLSTKMRDVLAVN